MFVIQLPIDFPSKRVEVIILPLIEKKSKKYSKKNIELPELISVDRKDYTSGIILEDRK